MLHLVIPGLIWPRQAWLDLTRGLPLPGLGALLRYARLTPLAAGDAESLLAAAFGLASPLPAATLRRRALGLDITDPGPWLCLDPVHLGFADRHLLVGDPRELAVSGEEAAELSTALTPLLTELGTLSTDAPTAWHLRLAPGLSPPATRALPDAIGLRADVALGRLDAPWRRVLNEVQVLLHAHPVNRRREAAGRAQINSLWPWGGGDLHPTSPTPIRLYAADAAWQGLGLAAGSGGEPLPAGAAALPSDAPAMALLDELSAAARRADALHWQQALLTLDANWLLPLAERFVAGRTRHAVVDFPGQPRGWRLELAPLDRWRGRLAFWRRPSLETLAA